MSRRRCCRETPAEPACVDFCLDCGLLFIACACDAVFASIVHCRNCGWHPPKAEEAMWAAQAAETQTALDEQWQ